MKALALKLMLLLHLLVREIKGEKEKLATLPQQSKDSLHQAKIQQTITAHLYCLSSEMGN